MGAKMLRIVRAWSAVALLVCSALWSGGAFAQYAHVQTTGSYEATFSSTTAGNLLVVVVYWDDSAGTNPAITGWTSAGAKQTTGGGYSAQIFYRLNNPGGITSVTVTSWDNGTPGSVGLTGSEYSGIATSSALIVAAGQVQTTPGTGTDAVTSGNGNVTSQPALIYGVSIDSGTAVDISAGTGFSSRLAITAIAVEDKRVTSTGNQATTFTAASGPTQINTFMVAFAEAGAGASGLLLRRRR
jgi:hypothetical protein